MLDHKGHRNREKRVSALMRSRKSPGRNKFKPKTFGESSEAVAAFNGFWKTCT